MAQTQEHSIVKKQYIQLEMSITVTILYKSPSSRINLQVYNYKVCFWVTQSSH